MGWISGRAPSRVRCNKCASVSIEAFHGKKDVRKAGGSMHNTDGESLCWKCSGCGNEHDHAHLWGPGDRTLERWDCDWQDWHPLFEKSHDAWEQMRVELRDAVVNDDGEKRDRVIIAMSAEVWYALMRLRGL